MKSAGCLGQAIAFFLTLTCAAGSYAKVVSLPSQASSHELAVVTFGGASNLPIWIAQREGFFAAEGLDVRLTYTPNSASQMSQLLAGKYDLAMTAMDNVVAYQEGQNEVPIPPNPDLFVFAGTDNSFLSLVSQPQYTSVESLRGKTLTVDAMTTGFAFVLREILERHGLNGSDVTFVKMGSTPQRLQDMLADPNHVATIQGTPFEFMGERAGFHTLLRVKDELGPYQGFVATAKRSWATAHDAEVVGFTRALLKGIDWLYQPANRDAVEAILVANVPGMTPDLAHRTYGIATDPNGGVFRDARPNIEGIRRVLELRSKFGLPKKELRDPLKYVDFQYLDRAALSVSNR